MAEPRVHRLRWPAKDRPSVGAPGIASRDDLFATACGNSDRNSCKSHTAGNTPPRTHHDGIVLYSRSGHARSAKVTTCSSPPSSPGTVHSIEALIVAVNRKIRRQVSFRLPRYQDLSNCWNPFSQKSSLTTNVLEVSWRRLFWLALPSFLRWPLLLADKV